LPRDGREPTNGVRQVGAVRQVELVGRDRPPEQVALGESASQGPQMVSLLGCFDALGYDVNTELTTE
jgi:hypothetical protein